MPCLVQGTQHSVDLESTWLRDLSGQQLSSSGNVKLLRSQPAQQLPQQKQPLQLRLLSCTAETRGTKILAKHFLALVSVYAADMSGKS